MEGKVYRSFACQHGWARAIGLQKNMCKFGKLAERLSSETGTTLQFLNSSDVCL